MNNNTEPFFDVHESGEHLVGVQGYFLTDETSDDMLIAVRFQFENEIVVLAAQDDDTLGVFGASWECNDKDVVARGLNDSPPWTLAVTRPLLWSWRMIDHLGCCDGVQLHFAKHVEDLGVQVQLIVVASEIKVKEI